MQNIKINLKDNNGISLIVLCIIILIIIIILSVPVYLFMINKEDKTVSNKYNILEKYNSEDIIVKVQNLEFYVDEYYNLGDKKKEQGYIIYGNGSIEEYDNINNNRKTIKTLKQEELNNLAELIQKINKDEVSEVYTSVAIPKGQIIKVYNAKKEEIVIQDFYSDNYSEAAKKIKEILKKENLL